MERFNLNDRVNTLALSNVGMVTITAIFTNEGYVKLFGLNQSPLWDLKFPNWRSKAIYLCKFDSPIKHLTLDEFKFHKPELSNEEAILEYEEIPNSDFSFFPDEALIK